SVGHFGFFVGALWSLLGPMPRSVEGSANATQLVFLAVFMSTGLIGAWAALRGRYLVEYCVLPFMGAQPDLCRFNVQHCSQWRKPGIGFRAHSCMCPVLLPSITMVVTEPAHGITLENMAQE